MIIAMFSGKGFVVSTNKVLTFDGLEWSGSLNTESQEKLKSKPSTYIKGQELGTMSFDVSLRADMKIDVRKEIEAWEAIRDKATPRRFILGQKPLGKNNWLLKTVAVTSKQIDNKGNILSATVKLSFEEYVRAGSAQASKASSGSASSGINTSNLGIVPSTYINKTESKRENPNAAIARRNAVEARLNQMGV